MNAIARKISVQLNLATIQAMEPRPETHFEFYECMINDKIAFVTADVNLKKIAPDLQRPVIAELTITLKKPRKNGLATREESDPIYEFEKVCDRRLWDQFGALRAGMIFTNGLRQIYFYLKREEDIEQVIEELLDQFNIEECDLHMWEDPRWEAYLDSLYPNPLGFQYITDRHTVQRLEDEGDPLTTPRPVSHWIYFTSEAARGEFVSKVNSEGFRMESFSSDPGNVRPWGVEISRIDPVKLNSIMLVTQKLWILADKLGGQYDGWECQVIKA